MENLIIRRCWSSLMDNIFELEPYCLRKEQKQQWLLKELTLLNAYHQQHSKEYKAILDAFGYKHKEYKKVEDFFALPVQIFKQYQLSSSKEIFKTLTSSGTTSATVSKIFLDKQTAMLQTKALVKIMQSFLSKQRLPMLIVDTPSTIKNKTEFSARAAGIMGLMNFGRNHTFVLNDAMELEQERLDEFLELYGNGRFLVFGFTFMVWEYFYKHLTKQTKQYDLQNGILFHSGGWKKLQELSVSNEVFKESFKAKLKLKNIHNFYGMVEQVGSIFVECKHGHLHTPNFADIIVRDSVTLKPLGYNEEGVLELVSLIPKSYPGHCLLSEDRGVVLGEDDCPCGRAGKYFHVYGRIKQAQQRGCSDTFAIKTKH